MIDTSKKGGLMIVIKECASGTVGGIAQVLVGQPFNTVKVRLQTQIPGQPPLYSNMLDCVRKTSKEGFSAFYKGTTMPLVGIGACVSIQFAVLEHMKRFFNEINNERNGDKTSVLTNSQLFLSGAAAGIANSVLSGPIEHIRTRLQVQITPTQSNSFAKKSMLYSGPIDCIKKIYSSYGIRGIYKGQMITMAREFQGYGTYFFLYELLKRTEGKGREIESWKAYLYGALAGYGMWLIIYPTDLLKSKLQRDGFTPQTRKYKNALDCFARTYRYEGLRGFFKGFGTVMLRAGPVNASTFMAYELAMKSFDKL
ncbi:mitochondrial carrier domain-containing protein [Gigaspora rosea]|uniref:Mitochondrial carrier domain-containing protein n=1 Tax=Gigaspora rosea TaxID=44941 RepID=A0A397U7S1_9GLOM|nr:mitochondrial carrier domain-containing protein [Gigaspora rosea]